MERSIHVGAGGGQILDGRDCVTDRDSEALAWPLFGGGQILDGLCEIAVRCDAPDACELPFGGGHTFPDPCIVRETEAVEQGLTLVDQVEESAIQEVIDSSTEFLLGQILATACCALIMLSILTPRPLAAIPR